jgi:cyanophycinase-like exopeptidase
MKSPFLTLCFLLPFCFVSAQNYTSWSVGASESIDVDHESGLVLMGGAGEMPEAMQWFLERAAGGDILVLRASGSDGYNDYLYSDLGVEVNRVETIRFNNPNASDDAYILSRIAEAEGIWLAGGDQFNYVQYWKGTPIEDALHAHVISKGGAIGGISAGLAILGFGYFAASNGTVYSEEALQDPYNYDMDVRYGDFLRMPWMKSVINDSHYDDPDRKGRHVAMLARLVTDHSIAALGIGCNEYTAVCIADDGFAHCYGEYPQYQEQVYFIRPTCLDVVGPTCVSGSPLDWGSEGSALHVFVVDATEAGNRGLDLNDWTTGTGGTWENWWVENGQLEISAMDAAPDCPVSSVNSVEEPYTSDTRQSFDLASGPGRSVTMTIAIECDLMVADSSGRVIKNHGVFSQGTHRVELPSTSNCYIFSDTRGALKSAVICK